MKLLKNKGGVPHANFHSYYDWYSTLTTHANGANTTGQGPDAIRFIKEKTFSNIITSPFFRCIFIYLQMGSGF